MHNHMSLGDYLALPGWRASSLRAMRRGPPARVAWELAHPPAETDAMVLGSLVDALVLDPCALDRYVPKPDGMSFATKEGKAWRDDPERAGRTIVPHAMWTAARSIADAVAARIGDIGATQVALQWQDAATGAACKGRLDVLTPGAIVDLKVTRHAGFDLPAAAWRMGWMHQLAWYRTGARAVDGVTRACRIVAVSATAPHYVYLSEVKPDALDLLELDNARTLAALVECDRTGIWPDTPDTYALIEPPAWAVDMTTTEEEE